MIQMIAFDIDNTMVATEEVAIPDFITQWNEDFGVPITLDQYYESFHGLGGKALVDKINTTFGTQFTAEEFIQAREPRVAKILKQTPPAFAPHLEEALKDIQQENLLTCTVSSSNQERIALMRQYCKTEEGTPLLKTYIQDEHIFSAQDADIPYPKPAPDILYKASRVTNIPLENILMIEDSPIGVQAGKAAGCPTWGYTGLARDKHHAEKSLKEAGADLIFHDWADFTRLRQSF